MAFSFKIFGRSFTIGRKNAALPMTSYGYSANMSRLGAWLSGWLLPSATVDYRRLAGDRWRNTIVAASCHWIGRQITQSPLRVYVRDVKGTAVPLPNHPLEKLLDRPNKYYDGLTMRKAIMLSLVAGASNAYLWIKRSNDGTPIELWYVPHFQIWPWWTQDSTTDNWIGGYIYRNNGVSYELPFGDVIHIRDGIDPYNQRFGLDLLDSASREVVADNEASGYLATMLKNMGIVPVLLSPKDPTAEFDESTKETVRAQFEEQTTGDNRFRPMVLSGGVQIDKVQLSPADMLLDKATDGPEARLCALIGVPAVVLGLKVGLEHSTYSNMEEARRAGWEDGIIPRNDLMCAAITHRLLPEFEQNPNAYVQADYSRVQALQDNQTDLITALTKAVGRPVLTVNEAREMLSRDGMDGGDDLYIPPAPTIAKPMGDEDETNPKNV